MKRFKVSRRGSRKLFKKTAAGTRSINVVRPMRGGFRL